jgi:hypothetical protein
MTRAATSLSKTGKCRRIALAAVIGALTLGAFAASAAPLPPALRTPAAASYGDRGRVGRAVAPGNNWRLAVDGDGAGPADVIRRSLDTRRAPVLSMHLDERGDPLVVGARSAELARLCPLGTQWATSPEWQRQAATARRQGISFLRPWQNSRMFVSIGLNRKGVPGIYIVQKTTR